MNLTGDVIYLILSKIDDYESFKSAQLVSKIFYKASKRLINYDRNQYNVYSDSDFWGYYPVDLSSDCKFNSFAGALQYYLKHSKPTKLEDCDNVSININQKKKWNGKCLQKIIAQYTYDASDIDWDRNSYFYLVFGLKKKNNLNLLRYNIQEHTIKTFECQYGEYSNCYSGNEYKVITCDTQGIESMQIHDPFTDNNKKKCITFYEGCRLTNIQDKLKNPKKHILFWQLHLEKFKQIPIQGFTSW